MGRSKESPKKSHRTESHLLLLLPNLAYSTHKHFRVVCVRRFIKNYFSRSPAKELCDTRECALHQARTLKFKTKEKKEKGGKTPVLRAHYFPHQRCIKSRGENWRRSGLLDVWQAWKPVSPREIHC